MICGDSLLQSSMAKARVYMGCILYHPQARGGARRDAPAGRPCCCPGCRCREGLPLEVTVWQGILDPHSMLLTAGESADHNFYFIRSVFTARKPAAPMRGREHNTLIVSPGPQTCGSYTNSAPSAGEGPPASLPSRVRLNAPLCERRRRLTLSKAGIRQPVPFGVGSGRRLESTLVMGRWCRACLLSPLVPRAS